MIKLVRLKRSILATLAKEGIPLVSAKSPITLFDEPEPIAVSTGNIEIILLEFDYLYEKVNFRIAVADTDAKLSDIVPLARRLSAELVIKLNNKLRQYGKSISCCKGCSACCSYMIPLSIPEIFRLNQEISTMPPKKCNKIQKKLVDTAGKILKEKPENLDTAGSMENNSQLQSSQLNKWYASLKMRCPFLSDNLCKIYHQRPLACREHIVTSTPSFCKIENNNVPDVVELPLSILETLALMTAELLQSNTEAIMLPLALPWAQENLDLAQRTWPARTMVEKFVQIVKTNATKKTSLMTTLT